LLSLYYPSSRTAFGTTAIYRFSEAQLLSINSCALATKRATSGSLARHGLLALQGSNSEILMPPQNCGLHAPLAPWQLEVPGKCGLLSECGQRIPRSLALICSLQNKG
jgi:hypothetical protein